MKSFIFFAIFFIILFFIAYTLPFWIMVGFALWFPYALIKWIFFGDKKENERGLYYPPIAPKLDNWG